MSVYAISYDLVHYKSEEDYRVLWDELERLKAHRTQLSMWLCDLTNSADEILQHLKKFVHDDDSIWVIRLNIGQFDYKRARPGTVDWLKSKFI